MSLTSLRDGVLQSKKIELAKCLATRKRKLSELLTVTIAYPDLPLRAPSPVTESTFLELNDIERGRLFNEATLPSRSQNATLAAGAVSKVSPPHTPKATTPSGSLDDSDHQPLEAPAITPLVPAQEGALSNPSLLCPASEDMGGRHRNQVSNGSQTTLITIEPPPTSRKASPAALPTPLTPLPPDGPEHVGADYYKVPDLLSVSALAAVARLESPPGSPGVNPQDAVPMSLEDVGTTPKLNVLDSDAIVSGISQEAATSAGDATCEPQASDKQSEDESSWHEQINQDIVGVQAQGTLGDESSPSSTVGPHSTNTSQINVPSPATTTEEAPTPTDTHRSGRKRPAPTQFSRDEESPPNMLHSTSAFKRRKTSHSDVHTPDAQLRMEDQLARAAYLRDHPPSVSVPDQEDVLGAPKAPDQKTSDELQETPSRDHAIAAVEVQNVPKDAPNSSSFDGAQGDVHVSEVGANKPDKASQADLEMTGRTNALDADTTAVKPKENNLPTSATTLCIDLSTQANKVQYRSDLHGSSSSPASFAPRSPVIARSGSLTRAEFNHIGSKPSSIGFARSSPQQSKNVVRWSDEDYQALRGCAQKTPQDYYRTLYSFEAHQKPRATSLHDLVANRVKIVSTADHLTALNEEQDYRILKRIKELQEAKSWSFLQMERCSELAAPLTHLDHLLAEVRGMALDFREERKWKRAVAKRQAQACADWVLATSEERASMQVKTKPARHPGSDDQRQDQEVEAGATSSPTANLLASTDTDSASHESAGPVVKAPMLGMLPPGALFALAQEKYSFPLKSGTASQKMFEELPLYNPYVVNPTNHDISTPIVPVSKYVTGKIMAAPIGPSRKRSRYDFEDDEDVHRPKRVRLEHQSSSVEDVGRQEAVLPPERDDVALFDPANLHQRERLWAAHSFRPPPAVEYPMPSQKFYEARWPSQWTQEDDDTLRDLVREYSYNWPLISSCMTPKTLYPPATERRTPWECFERWVRLEGLPPDMAKHNYFKTWQTRIEAARRANAARLQAAEQQQQGGPSQAPIQSMSGRVRPDGSTESFKVVKKRNTRHINFLSFFKRIAQRDETLKYKKEETRKAAQARKAQEVTQPRANVFTPQQWSQMKYERELKVMEKQQAWREQLLAQHRQAAMMQRSGQQPGQSSSLPNGVGQQQRHGGSILPNGQGSMPNGHLQPGPNPQARAHNMPPPMQVNLSNGGLPMNAAGPNGVPQAQMQPNMRGGQGFPTQMTPENIRMMQVRQSQVQRAYQSQQQFANQQLVNQQLVNQQHNSGQSAPGLMQPPANPHGGMYNPAQLAAMQAAANGNGISTPPANGGTRPSGSSGSPRAGQAYILQNGHPQPLSSGHVPVISHISHQIQAQQPHLSPDQVKHLSGEQLKQKLSEQQRQNALNAAAGNFAANNTAYQANGMDPSRADATQLQREAQYRQQMQQQMMRQQQQQRMQVQPGNNGFNGARPPSRSATPQHPQHQRTNSGQSAHPHGTSPQQRPSNGPMNQSQSPRPPQAHIGVNRQSSVG